MGTATGPLALIQYAEQNVAPYSPKWTRAAALGQAHREQHESS